MSKVFLKLVIPEPGSGTKPPPCTKEDPELFFPTSEGPDYQLQIRQAKAVCRKCPTTTKTNCLEFALSTGDRWAILGGTTPTERSSIQHRREERERRLRAA